MDDGGMPEMADRVGSLVMRLLSRSDGLSRQAAARIERVQAENYRLRAALQEMLAIDAGRMTYENITYERLAAALTEARELIAIPDPKAGGT